LQVRRETEAKFEQEVLVLKKDAETEKRLADLHVRTLEEARQAAQIVALEKQLVEAKQQVQDIAVKAIEGASGSKALSPVNHQYEINDVVRYPRGSKTIGIEAAA
jgi:colicin import membrane protein